MIKLKRIIAIIICIIIIGCTNISFAESEESIESIEIYIEVGNDGTATVTEIWEATIYSGTEMYKPYYDLETSEINNLSVTDETETEYTYTSNWDISASQSEKTNKCGIYVSGDETDICWGIGEYGSHTYTITYTISNFVQQYSSNDYQQIYFTLIQDGMDPVPESVKVTVSSDFAFTENNTSISGYGYSGTTSIQNGTAIFETNGSLGTSGYMTIYLKFSENPFEAEVIQVEDSTAIADEEDETSTTSWTSYIPYILIGILIILIIVYFFMSRRKNYNNNNYNNYQ